MPYLDDALDLTHIFSTCITIVLLVGMFAGRKFLFPFLSKKGENLAAKQDTKEITQREEEVLQKNRKEIKDIDKEISLSIEKTRADSQLRMVSADRRLEVYQQAYIFWSKLYRASPFENRESKKVIHEYFEWWENHRIYLGKEVDAAFYRAYLAALFIPDYRNCHEKRCAKFSESHVSTENSSNLESDYCKQLQKVIEENFRDIEKLGNIIIDSVQLPSLSTDELSMLIKSTSAPDEKTEDL